MRSPDPDDPVRSAWVVRDAVAEDAPALARVHRDSWRQAYGGLLDPDYLDSLTVEGLSAQWAHTMAGRTDDRLLVVGAADDVRGFAHVGPCHDGDATPGTTELYKLYIHPDWWGRGVGRAVHDAALDRLAAAGSRLVTLWVLGTNTNARRFYEHRGWSLVDGARVQYFGTSVCHDDRYARALPAR